MIYRLYSTDILNPQNVNAATTVGQSPEISFIFAPENSDYAQFKKDINEGAELQDADGNTMTAEQARDFVKELP